ncbi:hypothetical protein MN608_11232 [Microdochium nivale]|nr:hypothetical protein MN608_11232 [Microdochium nivale]
MASNTPMVIAESLSDDDLARHYAECTFIITHVKRAALSFGETIQHNDNGSTPTRQPLKKKYLRKVQSKLDALAAHDRRQRDNLEASLRHCQLDRDVRSVMQNIATSIDDAKHKVLNSDVPQRWTLQLQVLDQTCSHSVSIKDLLLAGFGVENAGRDSQRRVDAQWEAKVRAFEALEREKSREIEDRVRQLRLGGLTAGKKRELVAEISVCSALVGTLVHVMTEHWTS